MLPLQFLFFIFAAATAVVVAADAVVGVALFDVLPAAAAAAVPAGTPSRGGDVAIYVFDTNQPSLPTPFNLFLCLFLSLWPFQLYFIP